MQMFEMLLRLNHAKFVERLLIQYNWADLDIRKVRDLDIHKCYSHAWKRIDSSTSHASVPLNHAVFIFLLFIYFTAKKEHLVFLTIGERLVH